MTATTGGCWDLAVAAAAHHVGGNRLTSAPVNREIFQVSTIAALIDGVYDGETRYAEIMEHGDFGVGTFNALDGEMAAVDGQFFHLHSDGSVAPVDPAERAPFAAVAFFRADAELDIGSPVSRAELLARVDATVPSENLFYAIRIEGTFEQVLTRTAARQQPPYPPLVEATRNQVERTFGPVAGTMVGFRSPLYAQGTTVAGYHLHFIDDDRRIGGHVLDFRISSGTVLLDQDTELHVEMPPNPQFHAGGLSAVEMADQIERSEGSRAAGARSD